MYNDIIKELLKKHFGDPRGSLIIGDVSVPEENVYFYSLNREKEVTAIRDLLGMKHLVDGIDKLPELKQSFDDKNGNDTEIPQCVYFRERDGYWSAYFHRIIGVHYHRTYGNKVAAELQIDVHPFVVLSDCDDDFYGFWRKIRTRKNVPYNNRDGLSYWMNKALKTNKRFRGFAVDFFFAVAEAEHLYILKDAARAIANCGCFLPPISYQNLLNFKTPAELVHSFQEEQTDLNIDFNKVDVNVGYVMIMLAPKVEKRDWKLISKLDSQKVSDAISLNLFYDGFSSEEFVRWYYRKALEGQDFETEIKMYVDDYVEMCLEAEEKFRLCFDLDALIRAHDELSARNRMKVNKDEFKKPLVTSPSKFDELETAIKNTGSTEFERIVTTERLFNEGEYQHNCVFSRCGLLRRDLASIFRWDHDGESYTIQFSKDKRGRYSVDEIKARFNNSITEEHLRYLKQLLSGFCSVNVEVVSEFPQRGRIERPYPHWLGIVNDDEEFEFDCPF